MKRTLAICLILLLFCTVPCRADEIEEELHEQMKTVDFQSWQEFMTEVEITFDVRAFVSELAEGRIGIDEKEIRNGILGIAQKELTGKSVLFITLVVLGIVSVIGKESQSDLTPIAVKACTALTVCTVVVVGASEVKSVLENLVLLNGTVMSIGLPLVIASGGTATATALQPSVLIVEEAVSGILQKGLLPMTTVGTTLGICGGIANRNRLAGLTTLLKKIFNWGIGTVFVVLGGTVSVKSLIASGFDGTGLRVLKYTVGNSVPIIGSMMSDGIDLAMGCSVLIKNSVGIGAVVCAVLVVGLPALELLMTALTLRAANAVLGMMGEEEVTKLVASTAEGLTSLIVLLITAGLLISLSLLVLLLAGNSIGWVA